MERQSEQHQSALFPAKSVLYLHVQSFMHYGSADQNNFKASVYVSHLKTDFHKCKHSESVKNIVPE